MTNVLEVSGLRKEFGGLVAVRDVSFSVGEGEFVGLIGPNGCGKSTTFNCISGLLEKTSGSIEIFGEDASDLRPDQIQKLGMTRTFQHTNLERDDSDREPPSSSQGAVRLLNQRIGKGPPLPEKPGRTRTPV